MQTVMSCPEPIDTFSPSQTSPRVAGAAVHLLILGAEPLAQPHPHPCCGKGGWRGCGLNETVKTDAFRRGIHVLNKSSAWSPGSYLFLVILFTQEWINPSLQRNLLISEIKAASCAPTLRGSSWKSPASLIPLFGQIYQQFTNKGQKKGNQKLEKYPLGAVIWLGNAETGSTWKQAGGVNQEESSLVCSRGGHVTHPPFFQAGEEQALGGSAM